MTIPQISRSSFCLRKGQALRSAASPVPLLRPLPFFLPVSDSFFSLGSFAHFQDSAVAMFRFAQGSVSPRAVP